MKTDDFVSYNLAQRLKEVKFNEHCKNAYLKIGSKVKLLYWGTAAKLANDMGGEYVSAPTLWQAQKWLREKKELCVTVYAQPYNGLPYYTGYILFDGDEKEVFDQDGHWFDDYEKCLSETIAAALELIKKGE
jgi:hypothetical protein